MGTEFLLQTGRVESQGKCLRKNHLPVAPGWVNFVKNIDAIKTKFCQKVCKADRFVSKARDVVHGNKLV